MPIIGNGDVLDPSDFYTQIRDTGVTTCMIARGILYKPWLCDEIKAGHAIDKSARERLDIYRTFCRHGLEYWGTDQMGVDRTRRFLLEMLSFTHRYVPHGLLALPPQRMNLRPQPYRGRDDLETLLGSGESTDWVRITEMLLGPVRAGFRFVPKHLANTFGSGTTAAAGAVGESVSGDSSLQGLGYGSEVGQDWG
jgi:tRNA-dihydrouridine synthase 3